MDYKKQIKELLGNPEKLIQKKPFTRGMTWDDDSYMGSSDHYVGVGDTIEATPPRFKRIAVSQAQFLRELDVNCHDVLFNENLPFICVKIQGKDQYREVKYKRVAVPIQALIKAIQLIYLTGNNMEFTLDEMNPTEKQRQSFIQIKQMWEKRNQDGMRNKMVDKQMSCGDAGLLYYFDRNKRIKSRVLCYEDGFVLCPHNDENGDRIMECVYYMKDDVEYIDCYTDKYFYRYENKGENPESDKEKSGWHITITKPHGFEEIPLITKRGNVPWNEVQTNIEIFEEQYTIFNAIQRKFGWGIFYIKGKFKDEGKKIAGNVVLNDTSPEGKGDAKFLAPPSPDNMIGFLKELLSSIKLGSRTTFVLPEDIKISDTSGIAVMITKELDIQTAKQNVIDWQNVADKMLRLFSYGLAKELVNTGKNKTAVTDFGNTNMTAKFKLWRPFSEAEYNQMLATLTGAGLLSKESGIELNTVSKPDEVSRIAKEKEIEEKKAMEMMRMKSSTNEDPNKVKEGDNKQK